MSSSGSQINFFFLFGACYAYLDWFYDGSTIKWAKLALAIIATPPAMLSIAYLIRMKWYCLVFLANQTVEAFSLGFLSNYSDYYDDTTADIERNYDQVNTSNLYDYIMRYDDESILTLGCEYLMYLFGGSLNGQCGIIKRIIDCNIVEAHSKKEILDSTTFGEAMQIFIEHEKNVAYYVALDLQL